LLFSNWETLIGLREGSQRPDNQPRFTLDPSEEMPGGAPQRDRSKLPSGAPNSLPAERVFNFLYYRRTCSGIATVRDCKRYLANPPFVPPNKPLTPRLGGRGFLSRLRSHCLPQPSDAVSLSISSLIPGTEKIDGRGLDSLFTLYKNDLGFGCRAPVFNGYWNLTLLTTQIPPFVFSFSACFGFSLAYQTLSNVDA